jgi:hypothetical protein
MVTNRRPLVVREGLIEHLYSGLSARLGCWSGSRMLWSAAASLIHTGENRVVPGETMSPRTSGRQRSITLLDNRKT